MNGSGSEEEVLIRRAVAGNRRAFDQLVEKYHAQVYRVAYRFFNHPDDAFDATQEVFLRAFRALPRFEFRSSFKTWLFRIASNACVTLSETRKRQKKTILQSILDWFSLPPSPDPAKVLVDQEYQAELKKILTEKLERLPEVYRLPVILKDVEEFSLQEIGEILDLKEGTVKSRINRGRRLLQESLQAFLQERPSR